MADIVQNRRGKRATLPQLRDGEFGLCVDSEELFIGNGGNNLPVGGVKIAKLWQNGDPTAAFAEQSVMLDLSTYDAVEIYFKNKNNGSVYLSTGIIPKGGGFTLFYMTSDPVSQRRLGNVTDTGVYFQPGYSEGTQSNACAVPVTIWGYKGITDNT